jgi:hypothetical protein
VIDRADRSPSGVTKRLGDDPNKDYERAVRRGSFNTRTGNATRMRN